MKRAFLTLAISLIITSLLPLSGQNTREKSALSFDSLRGNWELIYDNNYGYSFRLGKNYRAIVILYLNDSSVIFKGIYTIEDSNTLRINISEMKREDKIKALNVKSGFVQVKSSYFIFKGTIKPVKKSRILELRPVTISIEGSDSEGYFEPLIELNYTGK